MAFSLAATLALLEMSFPWIDPVAIDLRGPLDVRWYGLMYLRGFAVAFFVLRWLARGKFLRLDPVAVGDLRSKAYQGKDKVDKVILALREKRSYAQETASFLPPPSIRR